MIIWENVINQDFTTEERIDISRFFKLPEGKKIFLTVREIDGINARRLIPFEGRLMTQKDGLLITQFTDQYDKKQADIWRVKFEHGIDNKKHNLKEVFGDSFELDISFWEECAVKLPALFKFIEEKIDERNMAIEPEGLKKKKSNAKKSESKELSATS